MANKKWLSILLLVPAAALAQDGAAIYKRSCSGCHDATGARVPPLSALRAMDAASISRTLESGVMKVQGAALSSRERQAVASYLASPANKPQETAAVGLCTAGAKLAGTAALWGAWGITATNTRFQEAAVAGLTAADVPKLKLKWAFGLGEGTSVRSQPAVAAGRVFTADLKGSVYALDANTGCEYWSFHADFPVRSAIVIGRSASHEGAIHFSDHQANVYSVNATTGKLLWKTHVDDHLAALVTGAPQLYEGMLAVPVASFEEAVAGSPSYACCTFRGSVVGLDAATGKIAWKTYTIDSKAQPTVKSKTGTQMYGPSGASVWSSPTFDKQTGVLYVATGDNYSAPATTTSDAVFALDGKTGKILWSKQLTEGDVFNNGCGSPEKTNCPDSSGHDFDFGQPPMLVSLKTGRRALVIGQKSGLIYALDPDGKGEILWQTKVGAGGPLGGIQWGSATDGQNAYVALSGLAFTVVADSSSPQGYSLNLEPEKGGGLSALRLETGDRVWQAQPVGCGTRKHCSPAQSAAVTAIPGVVFSGSVDGHLRAYSTTDGKVLWDIDTVREYETVNGQKARGGSLDVAGPVIADGMIYVDSGYAQWGGMPGNVLLAFSINGR